MLKIYKLEWVGGYGWGKETWGFLWPQTPPTFPSSLSRAWQLQDLGTSCGWSNRLGLGRGDEVLYSQLIVVWLRTGKELGVRQHHFQFWPPLFSPGGFRQHLPGFVSFLLVWGRILANCQDLIWFKLILYTDDRIVFHRQFAPSLKKSQHFPPLWEGVSASVKKHAGPSTICLMWTSFSALFSTGALS